MALDVAVSPEELRALLEMGFLLRERGELDKALEVFDGVLALRPDLEIAHIGLANVYQVQGNNAEAEKVFRSAVERFPQSAHAHAQLGEFFHTVGRKEDALAELEKAIQIDPSGPYGEAARAVKTLVEDGVEYSYGLPG